MKLTNFESKYNDQKRINIALVGHMGSGKSLIGRLISKKLKLRHVDSDELIEKMTKKTINDIFKVEGEKYFRSIEEKYILGISNEKNLVLSLGGGSILSSKVRQAIKKKFVTVFLDIDLNVIAERLLKSKNRPLILNTNIIEKIKQLDLNRRKYYLLSNIILNEHSSISNTLIEFKQKYSEYYEKNN